MNLGNDVDPILPNKAFVYLNCCITLPGYKVYTMSYSTQRGQWNLLFIFVGSNEYINNDHPYMWVHYSQVSYNQFFKWFQAYGPYIN